MAPDTETQRPEDHYDNELKSIRSAFKTGSPRQSLPSRGDVVAATQTARVTQHRQESGLLVDAVTVYLDTGDVPEAVLEVADIYDLEEVARDEESITFVQDKT